VDSELPPQHAEAASRLRPHDARLPPCAPRLCPGCHPAPCIQEEEELSSVLLAEAQSEAEHAAAAAPGSPLFAQEESEPTATAAAEPAAAPAPAFKLPPTIAGELLTLP
jgi:hypothetical protein